MFRNTIAAIMVGFFVVLPWPVFSITCDRCMEIEKEKKQVKQELDEGQKEMKDAFQKQEYDKMKTLRNRINDLRKKLIDLRKTDVDCRDACRPEELKKGECEKIKRELVSIDTDGEHSEDEIKKIDKLYEKLLECDREWRRMIGERP